MADDTGKGGISTPVLVALISLAGVLGAAAINNWDKITGGHAPAASSASGPTRDPAPIVASRTPMADPVAPPSANTSPPPIGTVALGGDWKDTDGYTYRFNASEQSSKFTYAELKAGEPRGTGEGVREGDHLAYRWESSTGDKGTCKGQINPDGTINAQCESGGRPWGVYLTR